MPVCRRVLQISCIAALLSACSGTGVTSTPDTANKNSESVSSQTSASPTNAGGTADYAVPAGGHTQASRQAAMRQFGSELATTLKLSEPAVLKLVEDARYNPTVIRIVTPPAAGQPRIPRSWATYKGRFVEPIRINQGRAFMTQYATELDRAAQRYGVPQSIIAAIIGVETLYGKSQGNFRVLDALASLGFDYPDPKRPDRAAMFRGQFADLIELDLTGRLDARSIKGSYAGAIGIPQFMPGSIKRFAVSADGNTSIDLSTSMPDAIASVANFLVEHGWQRGLPVFAPVILPSSAGKLVDGGLKPNLDWPQLRAAGAKLAPGARETAWSRSPLGVIDLPEESTGSVELRTATQNFFAITQYNRSYFYAASVADLAKALETR
ncbi:lytic murein transglycosylase B [Zwartia sp.]|uniref:lytic murein transglycosylase B n=1 Tax=Zwartia sp. TaxID=2978004 RepID=UPI00271B1C1A|nr:lytic murein transglycosylase B [Zwartia sp.]MDO9026151.1 lytic murein transglycosylase B [Zwartia sp.]